jgi:hypothetical protein
MFKIVFLIKKMKWRKPLPYPKQVTLMAVNSGIVLEGREILGTQQVHSVTWLPVSNLGV